MKWQELEESDKQKYRKYRDKTREDIRSDVERAASAVFKMTSASHAGGAAILVGIIAKLASSGESVAFLTAPLSAFIIGLLFSIAAATLRYFYFISQGHHLSAQWQLLRECKIDATEFDGRLPGLRKRSKFVRVALGLSIVFFFLGATLSINSLSMLP